jgi:hypothetical protein
MGAGMGRVPVEDRTLYSVQGDAMPCAGSLKITRTLLFC